jgi:hypothetical protein
MVSASDHIKPSAATIFRRIDTEGKEYIEPTAADGIVDSHKGFLIRRGRIDTSLFYLEMEDGSLVPDKLHSWFTSVAIAKYHINNFISNLLTEARLAGHAV